MIRNINKLSLILIVIFSVLFLSACDVEGNAILEGGIEAWAAKNDIYVDGNLKPAGIVNKIVQDKIGEITNSEKSVQFNGLDVIRDIETADNLASEAMVDFDISKMSSALSIRPEDWRLHEQSAVLWLAKDNGAAAQSAFDQSDELLKKSVLQGGKLIKYEKCLNLRRAQLETRLDTLWEAVKTYESQPGRSQGDAYQLRAEHTLVGKELRAINFETESPYCSEITK
jgi:hypothetical protein